MTATANYLHIHSICAYIEHELTTIKKAVRPAGQLEAPLPKTEEFGALYSELHAIYESLKQVKR